MELNLIEASAGAAILDAARAGVRGPAVLESFLRPFPRDYSLDALAPSIDECMRRFDNRDAGERVASDAWLGPRVHAAVRITRLEATLPGLWEFLAAYAFPDYVRWRWGEVYSRFTTPDIKKQAFARLWWAAELFRNAENYETAYRALSISDIPNTYLALRNVHNRGVALGLLRFIQEFDIGSRQANPLSTQLKTSAVTVALDRAWPARDDGSMLDTKWLRDLPEAREILASPRGPSDSPVSEEQLAAVCKALMAVIDLEKIREYRRRQGREQEPETEE